MRVRAAILLSAICAAPLAPAADAPTPRVTATPAGEIVVEAGPGGGAYLVGRPDKPGFYVMRVKFPDGFRSPPHVHDKDRYVTVISGVWHMGTDASGGCEGTMVLPPGSFAIHPAGALHYDGSCGGEVVVQIMGEGPVTTTLVP